MKDKKIRVLIFLFFGIRFLYAENSKVKSWQDYFPDPVERIYIIMKDRVLFKYTNYEERLIYLGVGVLEDFLKKKTYEIKDIAVIIHNHRFERQFSDGDWRFYKDLKRYGFEGLFLIYCHMTKKVYDIEDNIR